MTTEFEQECCDGLGGNLMQTPETNVAYCEEAYLLGRPYDLINFCEYYTREKVAREEFPYGETLFRIGLTLGSFSAFLIPSTSKIEQADDQGAPLVSTYTDVAKQTAEYGLTIFAVLVALSLFLIKKYMK